MRIKVGRNDSVAFPRGRKKIENISFNSPETKCSTLGVAHTDKKNNLP